MKIYLISSRISGYAVAIRLLILFLLFASCNDPLAYIKTTEYYQLSLNSLKKEGIENIRMLSKEEMENQKYIVFGTDTFDLHISQQSFGFLDRETKDIYIFKFYPNKAFRRFLCNSDWKVESELEATGDGQYIKEADSIANNK